MGYENHWLKVRQVLELAAAGAGVALAHGIFLGAYLAT
jgi:hypothetical protein